MIRALFTAAYLLLLVSLWLLPADARMHHPARGHRIVPGATAPPPLDGLAASSGAYGFRKLRSAYAGPGVKLQRVDLATQDIGFLGCTGFTGCPLDVAAAAAFCVTTCTGQTWYDQSGNGRDLVQATAANQPPLLFGCLNGLPCFQTTALNFSLLGSSFTPATGLVSLSAVGIRTTGTGTCVFFRENGTVNRLTAAGSANNWGIFPAVITAAAADNVWHAAAGVLSPTAGQSVLRIDGVETVGTTVPTTVAGVTGVVGVAATTCNQVEAFFWDNYALTSPERITLTANQRSFWGTP